MANLPVPNPGTQAPGFYITSALWNATVRDGLKFFASPPIFHAYQTAAQSFASGQTPTSLLLDTESVDNYGGHSTVSNTSRYVCQLAGWYYATARCSFPFASGTRGLYVSVNGNSAILTESAASPSSNSWASTCSGLIYLNVADYVETQAWQNSGGSLSTNVSGTAWNPALSLIWVSQ